MPAACLSLVLWKAMKNKTGCTERSCLSYGKIICGVLSAALLLHLAQLAVLQLRSCTRRSCS